MQYLCVFTKFKIHYNLVPSRMGCGKCITLPSTVDIETCKTSISGPLCPCKLCQGWGSVAKQMSSPPDVPLSLNTSLVMILTLRDLSHSLYITRP